MNTRRTPLIVGLVLAIGTGLLLLNFLTQARGSTAAVAQRSVVIAMKEIPARARIVPGMISTATRNADQLDSDAVSDTKNVTGRVALITIPVGSTVTQSKIVTPAALALPMRLRNGLRAVSISIDRVKGVSGLIQPGDRVDVIAVPPRVGNETPKATSILRGALVLALGNETETASATPAPDNQNLTTVTLAVSPQQANLLALADVYTTLRLALRSPEESLHSYPVEPIAFGVAERPAAAPAAAPMMAPPAPIQVSAGAAKPAVQSYVTVIEGDRIAPPQETQR
jgi:pilus assembly protein CpaB